MNLEICVQPFDCSVSDAVIADHNESYFSNKAECLTLLKRKGCWEGNKPSRSGWERERGSAGAGRSAEG